MSEIQKLWTIHINARAASCAEIWVWEMSCPHIVIQLFLIPLLNALRESPLFGNCNSLTVSMTALEPDAGIHTLCETPSTWSYPRGVHTKVRNQFLLGPENDANHPSCYQIYQLPNKVGMQCKFAVCNWDGEWNVSNCPWGPFKTNRWIHRSGVA